MAILPGLKRAASGARQSLGNRAVRAALLSSAASVVVRAIVGQYDSSPRTVRRDFLRWTVAGVSTFFLAEASVGFVAFFWPQKIGAFGSEINVAAADIPKVGEPPVVNREGKFWLINNDDGVLALYWKCVHLGCTVPWNENEKQFHCPCHGSLYNRQGVVTGGPAPRPLDIMTVKVDGGNVTVDTGDIKMRPQGDGSGAVKVG
jgi:cytochrome b6-f complex iron-sulfur subunit